jgi:ABC-type phosphate transport system substrate-binding protein
MMRRSAVLVRALVVVGILAAVAGIGMSTASADGPIVTGGGSSFVGLEVSQWRADVAKPPYNLKINYTSAGSGFGRDKYSSGAIDFGQSDIPFLPEELPLAQKRGPFVYVPTSAGALAFLFNVVGSNGSRITNLKLTADAACKLFTVPDIQWNDPVIAATNPGVPLPARKVRPIVRSDRSGTSYVLSEFCIARAAQTWSTFKAFITAGNYNQDQYLGMGQPISQWPTGYGAVSTAFASDGIGRSVGANADSVTYIETGYTKVTGLPAAFVQNPAGVFTPPNPANSTVALGYATPDPSAPGTFKLSYTGGDPRAYFPSTYSYAIAQTTGFPADKGKVLATYLDYVACQGQARAEPLLYSRLSIPLVNIALDAITKIPGAPPRPATASCNAPPPPALKNAPAVAGAGKTAGSGGGGAGPGTGTGTATPGAGDAAAAPVADAAQNAAEQAAAADDAAAAAGGGDGATNTKNTSSSGTGPENSDVLFTFLLGAGLVAIGTFVSRGTRSSWQR